jgi:hypothetical protein
VRDLAKVGNSTGGDLWGGQTGRDLVHGVCAYDDCSTSDGYEFIHSLGPDPAGTPKWALRVSTVGASSKTTAGSKVTASHPAVLRATATTVTRPALSVTAIGSTRSACVREENCVRGVSTPEVLAKNANWVPAGSSFDHPAVVRENLRGFGGKAAGGASMCRQTPRIVGQHW